MTLYLDMSTIMSISNDFSTKMHYSTLIHSTSTSLLKRDPTFSSWKSHFNRIMESSLSQSMVCTVQFQIH